MVTLTGRQRAPFDKKSPRMPFQNLHGPVGPAEALFLEIDEGVGHEAPAVTLRHVARLEAGLENPQTELGILGDAPLGPTSRLQLRAADHGHGAVLNDGVALVAGDHADVEETTVLGITHRLEGA